MDRAKSAERMKIKGVTIRRVTRPRAECKIVDLLKLARKVSQKNVGRMFDMGEENRLTFYSVYLPPDIHR